MNVRTQPCNSQRIADFLARRLSESEQAVLESHLTECEDCRVLLGAQTADDETWNKTSLYLRDEYGEPFRETWDATAECEHPHSIHHVLDALAPTDDPDMLGRLGGYEISGVVGSGGMGVVLKALDTSLDRTVAIKVMAPHLASSGAARKRFAREAKAAAAVLHPNVMAIHSVSNDESLPFLVMPYMRGTSLQKRLDAEGSLPLGEILRIAAQTAAGLAAAHAQGLVHRDIKPANIMLEAGVERVAITDFGLARAVDDATMTRTGVVAGTPQYMSPEQARGESVYQSSDLFSLGSVLYAMCTGRPPFRAESSYGVLRRITDDEPKSIREINPEIPEWLCAIIGKLMSKLASDRCQTAAEVAALLEDCLAHVQQPTMTPLPESVASLNASRGRRSHFMRLCGAAAFAVVLIFSGVLIVLELNKGQLTIQSDADDVPIRIMQGDKMVEELTVSKSGKTVRIAAGNYLVEIGGDIDGIVVANGIVTLKRGGEETVKIVRSEGPERDSNSSNVQQPHNSDRELAAALRNVQLRRERLVQTHGEQHPEVIKLVGEFKAIEALMERLADVPATADPVEGNVPSAAIKRFGTDAASVILLETVADDRPSTNRTQRIAIIQNRVTNARSRLVAGGTPLRIGDMEVTARGVWQSSILVEEGDRHLRWYVGESFADATEFGPLPPTTHDAEQGIWSFPVEFEGTWRIADATQGGRSVRSYVGQPVEISGSAIMLRSGTTSNTYHLTLVKPLENFIALNLSVQHPIDSDQVMPFRCILKVSENSILLCRPGRTGIPRPQNLEAPDDSEIVFTFVRDNSDAPALPADTWKQRISWFRRQTTENQGEDSDRVEVYSIGHLPIWARDQKKQHAGLLIRYLKTHIDPSSWETGSTNAAYDAKQFALVVRASAKHHDEIAELMKKWVPEATSTGTPRDPDSTVLRLFPIGDLPLWTQDGTGQLASLLIHYLKSVIDKAEWDDGNTFAWYVVEEKSLAVKANEQKQKKIADAISVLRVEALLERQAEAARVSDYVAYVDLLTDDEVVRLAGVMLHQATVLHTALANSKDGKTQSTIEAMQRTASVLRRFRRTDPPPDALIAYEQLIKITLNRMLYPDTTALESPDRYSRMLSTAAGRLTDGRQFTIEMMIAGDLRNKSTISDDALPTWNIVVDGNHATATEIADKSVPTRIELSLTDGQWKISNLFSDEAITSIVSGMVYSHASTQTQTAANPVSRNSLHSNSDQSTDTGIPIGNSDLDGPPADPPETSATDPYRE